MRKQAYILRSVNRITRAIGILDSHKDIRVKTMSERLIDIHAAGPGKTNIPDGPDTGVAVKARAKTKKPAMYKVLMLNDDYTPMEFVVYVLEKFFSKNHDEAMSIMLHVHQRGVGVCGVFTYEVAETKATQVMDLARQNDHPLQCTIEKDGDE